MLGGKTCMKGLEPDLQAAESSVRHFERVLALTKHLATRGIAIRGHEYEPHFFGMWKIVAGSFPHRYQFLWDARDQILTISEASFNEFGSQDGDWKPYGERSIDARHGADPFKYVQEFFE